MRTTYEIDCLKSFSKLSISSPPSARKEYRSSGSTPDYRQNVAGYKPMLPRLEFPTSQFDRLLHMDQKELKNSWRSSSGGHGYDGDKKKK